MRAKYTIDISYLTSPLGPPNNKLNFEYCSETRNWNGAMGRGLVLGVFGSKPRLTCVI